jgi:pilus assembly protein CpaF
MALFSFDRKESKTEPVAASNGNGHAEGANGNGNGAATGLAAPPPPLAATPQQPTITPERQAYLTQMRVKVHQKLVERLNVQNLRSMPINVVRQEVRTLIRELYQSEKGLLSSAEQSKLMDDVMDETFGLGPLEGLLKDPTITDILVNKFDKVYVERKGQLEQTDVSFRDNAHLRQIIDRIVVQVGRRVDEISPMVDARLSDGSRVNAIIPPLALDGPAMSIRRFGHNPLTIDDLIKHGSIPPVRHGVLRATACRRGATC